MSENHTPTPWEIYECPITGADAAKEELAYQVDHTEPVGPTLYLLNAGGKCPALTGCGPSSKANAEFIVTAVNSYASSQAEIERLKAALCAAAEVLENYADPSGYRDTYGEEYEESDQHPGLLAADAAKAARAALGSKD